MKSILAVVAIGCVGMALGAIPPAPSVEEPAVPYPHWMTLDTDAAVAERVHPMKGTVPARFLAPGVLELPVHFTDNPVERANWDVQVPLDLQVAEGIQFDFYCEDLSPFSSFSLYFKSGDGWYNTTFSPEAAGTWNRINVSKAEARAEGRASGWGSISAIRLSGWRCGTNDTVCAIANLTPVGGHPKVLVVRAESMADRMGAEASALWQYAGTVCSTFSALGVEYGQVSDLELTETIPDEVKLVVLPYNPTVPDRVVEVLKPFVARGGRLLVCYTLPGSVGSLMGMRTVELVRPPQDGRFAGFERVGDGVKGQPDYSPQASWIAYLARPTGKGETLAVWRDGQGKRTDWPAIVRTDGGMFIGHVWLGGTDGAPAKLMGALVGDLIPEIWETSAKRAYGRIGQIAYARNVEQLRGNLPETLPPASGMAWRKMETLRDEARRKIEAKEWEEGIALSEEAAREAERAWMAAQPVRRDTFRGFWCHSAWGLPNRDWDASIRFLKENGFNAILPNFSWGGVAFYPSEHLPVSPSLEKRGNPVEACLAACRKYGVKCHIWKVCWNLGGYAPQAFVDRMAEEKRTAVRFNGQRTPRWLCPSDPRNRDLEIAAMVELARFPTDGIHFDYIRYSDSDTCFCDGCRERFERQIGRPVERWPQDVRSDPKLAEAWQAFRCGNITAVVEAVHRQVKAAYPKMSISAAVFRNPQADPRSVAQDWSMWCRNGWLDFVCPMDYVDSPHLFRNAVIMQRQAVGRVPVYPGIGLSCWKNPDDAVNLALQIQAARSAGAEGFTVFNFDGHAERVLPILRHGPVRDD